MSMEINPLGLYAALAAFLGVWVGHVMVRRIEAAIAQLWIPMAGFFLLGAAMEILSICAANRSISVICGILGVTLLWDVLELWRQAKRVVIGHAPANPGNPRHAHYLQAPGTHATTLDPLEAGSPPFATEEQRS